MGGRAGNGAGRLPTEGGRPMSNKGAVVLGVCIVIAAGVVALFSHWPAPAQGGPPQPAKAGDAAGGGQPAAQPPPPAETGRFQVVVIHTYRDGKPDDDRLLLVDTKTGRTFSRQGILSSWSEDSNNALNK
jgi:hypothetical protein